MNKIPVAKFNIGQVIRHRLYAVRGVVFDVDPEFDSRTHSQESILIEERFYRDQPFYYLFAEGGKVPFVAYVSEQNLLADASDEPVDNPRIDDLFERDDNGSYRRRRVTLN